MKDMPLTRRRFLEGCAGTAALAAVGGSVCAAQAFAEGGQIGVGARPEWSNSHTICEGCPNACGFQAYVVDGMLEKTLGDATNPNAAGRLCVRGYGYTQTAFSDARVKNPLRRKDNGEFQTISWDEALQEIGDRLSDIVGSDGPQSLALIYSGVRRNARMLSAGLMASLGSGNLFVDDVTYDVVKGAALKQAIGTDQCFVDVAQADMVLLVDSSLTDITTPNLVASLQQVREAGGSIVAVDPRLGTLASFADEWYATNPGAELALLLSICQYLIAQGRYDKDFVADNVADFDAWADAIASYTPSWAESVTGIEGFRIEELANKLEAAAPKVSIVYGNGSIAGTSYTNSPQTEHVICLLNALLGAWNQPGGTYLPYDFEALAPDVAASPEKVPNAVLEGINRRDGVVSALDSGALYALLPQRNHDLRALIAVDADIAYDYSSIPEIRDELRGFDLFVCITEEMTLTAEQADYVLPLSSYLEQSTIPEPVQGAFAAYATSSAVLEAADGKNAWPLERIIDGLAEACHEKANIGQMARDAVDARIEACGLDAEGLALEGVAAVSPGAVSRIASWNTPSGKIECFFGPELAPHDRVLVVWVEPIGLSDVIGVVSRDLNLGEDNETQAVVEGSEEPTFKLITGQQSVVGMHGYNTAELMDISDQYDLDAVWINEDVAATLGISQGDEVIVFNDVHACEARANVTQRIVPTAIYVPMAYGRESTRQRTAKGHGENAFLFSTPTAIPGTGALCTQEACVSVLSKKEGA